MIFGFLAANSAHATNWTVTKLSTNDSGYHSGPYIYGSTVVWEGRGGTRSYYDYEVFLYDGNSTTQLTNNSYHDSRPRIYGSNVVWSGYDGNDKEIFLYDVNTKVTTQLTNNSYDDRFPEIYGSNVVWQGGEHYDAEIFLYDGNSTTNISNTSHNNWYPQIQGSSVVWWGDDGGGDTEIFFYDGNTGVTTQMTDNSYNDDQANVYGSNVVWTGREDIWHPQIFLATPGPEPTIIGIDIRPGSDQNPVNLKSNGVLPVAILGDDDFDVYDIDLLSLSLDGATPKQQGNGENVGSFEDINGDDLIDLLLHFDLGELDVDGSFTELTLDGLLNDGTVLMGTDSVRIVPPGDVNGDGSVGAADLTTIVTNWGMTGALYQQGDLNGDGTVSAPDYTEVISNWGSGTPPPSEPPAATPEPATLALLIMGGLAILRRPSR